MATMLKPLRNWVMIAWVMADYAGGSTGDSETGARGGRWPAARLPLG